MATRNEEWEETYEVRVALEKDLSRMIAQHERTAKKLRVMRRTIKELKAQESMYSKRT